MDNASNDKYQYYDIDKIRKLIDISEISKQNGKRLNDQQKVTLKKIAAGYLSYESDMAADVEGSAENDNEKNDITMQIIFTRDRILHTVCSCPQCRRNSYSWNSFQGHNNCEYISALLDLAEKHFKNNRIGDATDRAGSRFLGMFQKKREMNRKSRQISALNGIERQSNGIELVPRLTKNNFSLELGFRIGSSKKFMIKNFNEFCEHVRNAENAMYGSKTEISHDPDDFTPEARSWIRFIMRIVQEDAEQYERMQEMTRFSLRKPKNSVLLLYGWRLDKFWDMAAGKIVEYEDKDLSAKLKFNVAFKEKNPEILLNITKINNKDNIHETEKKKSRSSINEDAVEKQPDFDGIEVSADIPCCWEGMENLYFLTGDTICRADKKFSEGIRQIIEKLDDNELYFRIGRNRLSEFYNDVLPEMSQYMTVYETDSQEIREHVSPEASFTFYLDIDNEVITCKAYAAYGDNEFQIENEFDEDVLFTQPFRQKYREKDVIDVLTQLFNDYDHMTKEFICIDDEEKMYAVLSDGADILSDYGDVMSTSRFQSMNTSRQMRVSVGVSVSQGLLDLQITTEDISREELLEILSGYKTDKKFYRLKSGDFLDMQSESLLMLNELVRSLNVPLKELLKEKIEIPAYRTLYLDTLLDENKSVYADRDRNFRQLVRNFRTVSDADFDEPVSLSGVMRGYQKDGFKWIKTLEKYGFGGILADDMGLGKTLQAVAVLLADSAYAECQPDDFCRQSGDCGSGDECTEKTNSLTSLVVSSASLVYNWLEEINRYAPMLKVLVIAGSKNERIELIEKWQSYDVVVTSYDLLKRDITCYEGKTFYYEIIDEAQYIKNHTTAAAKAVKVIKSRRKLALTGTPVENRLSELWSIFDFLMPGFMYGYDTFKKNFETPIVKYDDQQAKKRLQQMVSPFILRRLKKDVLKDLPDKLEENRIVQFEEKQQQVYDAQVVHMQKMLEEQAAGDFNKSKLQILAELMRLRQICCDPSLCFNNYDGGSAKLESCMDLIESAIDGEHRMLLFSQFTSMLDIISRELKKRNIEFYSITGTTSKKERLELVRAFNENKVPVFLISLKAGGTGLNLTGADIVIHYDPWWNVAAQNQATDRAHRIGQTKKVTVYKMIVKNSIEEKIQQLQEAKKDLADSIVNAADGINLSQLTQDDLLSLLR